MKWLKLWQRQRMPRYVVFPPYDPERPGRTRYYYYRQKDGSYRNKGGYRINDMIVEAIVSGKGWDNKPVEPQDYVPRLFKSFNYEGVVH